MDSLFHFNYLNKKDSLLKSIGYTLLVYAISSFVFYIYGKIINKKTRFIDIITPVLISQCVGIFVVLLSEIPLVKNAQQEILSSTENIAPHFSPLTLITILVFSILSLTISVYGIALFYNGFKTATNMKNWYHIVVFAILLLTLMISMQFLQKIINNEKQIFTSLQFLDFQFKFCSANCRFLDGRTGNSGYKTSVNC